ncbi:MAG: site-specific integrase [Chloroflexi bacterium]|nr:site-specific integrase [Chloroflexota bacterium]
MLQADLEREPIQGDDLVFTTLEDRPALPDTVTHAWIKTARRAGFPHIRLHNARHTHATLLLKQGVNPKVVQERLGHACITTTLDTYSHVLPGLQQSAALNFDLVVQPVTGAAIRVIENARYQNVSEGQNERPPGGAFRFYFLVAGVGFEPTTFGL